MTIQRIHFFPRRDILQNTEKKQGVALISISSNTEEIPVTLDKHYDAVLFLQFDDDETSFKKEHAAGIMNFVDKVNDDSSINLIYVHCTAGISRSAAVAKILGEYLNVWVYIRNEGPLLKNYSLYNKRVYATLAKELHIDYSPAAYYSEEK